MHTWAHAPDLMDMHWLYSGDIDNILDEWRGVNI